MQCPQLVLPAILILSPLSNASILDFFGLGGSSRPKIEGGECAIWPSYSTSYEVYDSDDLIGFHRSKPIGSYLTIYNDWNNKSVSIRVVAHGPIADGRVVEMSPAAFAIVEKPSSQVFSCTVVSSKDLLQSTTNSQSQPRPNYTNSFGSRPTTMQTTGGGSTGGSWNLGAGNSGSGHSESSPFGNFGQFFGLGHSSTERPGNVHRPMQSFGTETNLKHPYGNDNDDDSLYVKMPNFEYQDGKIVMNHAASSSSQYYPGNSQGTMFSGDGVQVTDNGEIRVNIPGTFLQTGIMKRSEGSPVSSSENDSRLGESKPITLKITIV